MIAYSLLFLLNATVDVVGIAAEVTVLYAVIPLWLTRRLRFAFLLACSSSLSLLLTIFYHLSRGFSMSELTNFVVWSVWYILAAVMMLLYVAAFVQIARHLRRKAAPLPDDTAPQSHPPTS